MTNFLYILPFKDQKHFKIGISSKDFSRIKYLNKIYDIDFDKSFIVYSKERNIKILEKELLEIFDTDECDKFETDGYTEIRNIKYFDECLQIIDSKHENLKYVKQKFDTNVFDNIESTFVKRNLKQKPVKKVRTKDDTDILSKCGLVPPKVSKVRNDLNQTIIHRFVISLEKLFDKSYDVQKIVREDYIKFELKYDFDVKSYHNNLRFTLISDNFFYHKRELFGISSTITKPNNIGNVCSFDIVTNIEDVTHFEYDDHIFEANIETNQLLQCFRQTLEMKYYCQNFEIKDSFHTLVKNGYISSLKFVSRDSFIETDEQILKEYIEYKNNEKKIKQILA